MTVRTAAVRAAAARLAAEYGEAFVVEQATADRVVLRRGGDHAYYEPHPVRYVVDADGGTTEIDRYGDPIEADE